MTASGTIRAGMGGWTFEPWEGTFYPDKLSKKKQLEFASRQVPTIEVNGTYYSGFKPDTYAKWNAETPEGFVFSIKGNRFVTNRKVLAEAGESMRSFSRRAWRSSATSLARSCGNSRRRKNSSRTISRPF